MRNLLPSGLREHVKRGWRSAMLPGVLGTGIRAGANMVLFPLMLIKLSKNEQAVWWLFLALGGFGNLTDFGFGSTIPRIYNYLWAGAEDFDAEGLRAAKTGAEPNIAGIARLNATVRLLYLKISLVAVFSLAVAGTFYLIKPAVESGFEGRLWWLWAFYVVTIGYSLASSHWMLAVQGLNRVRELQVAFVWSGLSYVACAVLLLMGKMGLTALVVASFVRICVLRWRCHKIYRAVIPGLEKPAPSDPKIVRKLWPNAYKFGLLSLGGYFMANGPLLICGHLLPNDTAAFGVTVQIGAFMMTFAALWLVVKWPEIAILRTQGQQEQMAVLFARRLVLVMASFVGLGLIVFFAGNTLLAWKGSQGRLLAQPYLAFYLIYLAQQIFYVQFASFVYTENVVPFFTISIYTGLASCALVLVLTPLFGLWGLLVAPLIAEASYCGWFIVRRGFRGQPLGLRQFVLAAIRGHL